MKAFLFVLLTYCCSPAFATHTDSVKISFEKKINIHKIYKDKGDWGKSILSNFPQYQVENFSMLVAENQTLYMPVEVEDKKRSAMWGYSLDENMVYTNFSSMTTVERKQVYEKAYLISDSLRPIKWKISNDMRSIAGYNCRKASAVIYDSMEVYAFYTEEITVSGGPETFSGLPGMILGLAIPDIHTTWFATKVESSGIDFSPIKAPAKGKKTTFAELESTLEEVFKEWGDWGKIFLWMNLI